jgi:hypothetical protein
MKEITYRIATTAGMKLVDGEECGIPNGIGAEFGIHEDIHYHYGHPERWAVTHLASGAALALGPTRKMAIQAATDAVRRKGDNSLRISIERGMEQRREIESRECELTYEDDEQ